MRTARKLFSFSFILLYLSFTPWVIPPRPPLPERIKPRWIRQETIQRVRSVEFYTPAQLMSVEADFGKI